MEVLLQEVSNAAAASDIRQAGGLTISEDRSAVFSHDGTTAGGASILDSVAAIVTPAITSPVNMATGVAQQPTLTATPYSGNFPQTATTWEIASDAGFSALVVNVPFTATHMASLNLALLNVTLTYGVTYYARVKYHDSTGFVSEWSSTVSFTIDTLYVAGNVVETFNGYQARMSDDGKRVVMGDHSLTHTLNQDGRAWVHEEQPNGTWATQELLPSVRWADGQFGWSIQISGDGSTIVVGARYSDAVEPQAGAVFIFVKNGSGNWVEQAYLTPDYGTADGHYGHAISLKDDGNILAIGAPYEDSDGYESRGSVYIYSRSGTNWTLIHYRRPTSANNYSLYGWAVSLSGDGNWLAVGAQGETVQSGYDGKVFIYEWNGTNYPDKTSLVGDQPNTSERFGLSVCFNVDGTTLAVGTYNADYVSADSGVVYVYDYSAASIVLEQKLIHSGAQANDKFGISPNLSADGNTLTTGAVGVSHGGFAGVGSVFLFVRDNGSWSQYDEFPGQIVSQNAFFGLYSDMSSDGKRLVVTGLANSFQSWVLE